MPRGRRRASMTDVGRHAGVSAQTVSRYFNDGYVSAQVRERIESAVAELGYVRNRLPVQMRRAHTDMIGVVLFGPLNFGNAQIMTGIYRQSRALGLTVMTTHMEDDPLSREDLWDQATREVERFLSLQVDGLILASPYASLSRILEVIADAVPVALVGEGDTVVWQPPEQLSDSGSRDEGSQLVGGARRYPSVASAEYSLPAGREVMEHLVALGHRRIVHVSGPLDRVQARERRQAYWDVLEEAGIEPLPVLECREWSTSQAALVAQSVEPHSFTAVFAANDDLALGFQSVMRRRGMRVPDDYVIAGFDDMPQARYYDPPLTTVRVDFGRMGENAVRRVASMVSGEVLSEGALTVPTQLMVRESTLGYRSL